MPGNEEHCVATLERYGVRAEEVHRWMDEPCRLYGVSHRKTRHDFNQPIPDEFVRRYGEAMARNIMNDHILMDLDSGQLSNQDIKDIRYGRTGADVGFDVVWGNILGHQGEAFYTLKKREFSYEVRGDSVVVDKKIPPIKRSEVERAYGKMPVYRPSDLDGIMKGTSYAWGLLNDPRIIQVNESGALEEIPICESKKMEPRNKSCKTCAWAFFLRKTKHQTGSLGLFQDTVFTLTYPTRAKQKNVDLYCLKGSGCRLSRVRKVKRFTKDEVSKIGFFSSPCDSWVSKNK
jgi:hypothetical protein